MEPLAKYNRIRNHCLTIAPDDNQYNYNEQND